MNELRADLTNIPTSGRLVMPMTDKVHLLTALCRATGRLAVSCSVRRTKIAMIAVKSYIRHDKQLFSCLDRKSK